MVEYILSVQCYKTQGKGHKGLNVSSQFVIVQGLDQLGSYDMPVFLDPAQFPERTIGGNQWVFLNLRMFPVDKEKGKTGFKQITRKRQTFNINSTLKNTNTVELFNDDGYWVGKMVPVTQSHGYSHQSLQVDIPSVSMGSAQSCGYSQEVTRRCPSQFGL